MGTIKKILENLLVGGISNTDIYPVTSTKAVFNPDNVSVDTLINNLTNSKIDKTSINENTGNSSNTIISQKAITELLSGTHTGSSASNYTHIRIPDFSLNVTSDEGFSKFKQWLDSFSFINSIEYTKYLGRCRCSISGRNIEVYNHIISYADLSGILVIMGPILYDDKDNVLKLSNEYNILWRYKNSIQTTTWSLIQKVLGSMGDSNILPMSQRAVTEALNLKLDKTLLVSSTGNDETKIMNLKAVTNTIGNLSISLNKNISDLSNTIDDVNTSLNSEIERAKSSELNLDLNKIDKSLITSSYTDNSPFKVISLKGINDCYNALNSSIINNTSAIGNNTTNIANITNELSTKVNNSLIVLKLGNSETDIVSQKIVTANIDSLNIQISTLESDFNNNLTNITDGLQLNIDLKIDKSNILSEYEHGTSVDKVISQKVLSEVNDELLGLIQTNEGQIANIDNILQVEVEKNIPIIQCDSIISQNVIPSIEGTYLRLNDKNKIVEVVSIIAGEANVSSPEIGKLYLCNDLYYGFTGKELVPIGGATGSGTGNGFFDITKAVPLELGYYTLDSALLALKTVEIEDDLKFGMIITFEVSSGVWKDYRFIGTNVNSFYEPSAWEEYGTKGVVKKLTMTYGLDTSEITPDNEGNVNINIPVVEVDETIDANSTNPVLNKAIAASLKEFGGKYGASLRLNTIGEGDNVAYSLTLLDEYGLELNTSESFTGGGGGTVATTKIVLTRITPNLTVKNGDTVELSYKYDLVDTTTGESTGNSAKATMTITRGATSYSLENVISAGSTQKINITDYLGVGTNNVKVKVEVGEGEEKQVSSISWTISVIQLILTSSFNIATLINKGDRITIPYSLTGSGTKTLRCFVDGIDVEDRTISSSTANGSFSLDSNNLNHGEHSVLLVSELELIDGNIIKSNSIYFDVAIKESGNNTPIIATRFDYQDGSIILAGDRPYIKVQQYDNYTINYAAYNPNEVPTTVNVYEENSLTTSSKVSFISTYLTLRAFEFGNKNFKFVCDSKEYLFNVNIIKSDLNLTEPTDGMQLKLSALGKTNNDNNRELWEYNGITTEFSGFNWGGNGWINGALKHTNEARSIVKYKPLGLPAQNVNDAFAFIIKYKASEVINDNAAIITCVDDEGTGFIITPTEARMVTKGNSTLSMKMASDNIYEVGFVSFPIASAQSSEYEKKNTEMVYLYINGIMSGSVQRGTSDSIYQNNPSYIKMGAEGATLDVYLMRGYNTFLTDDLMLSCYIIDQSTVDELISKYNSNDILDGDGNINIDNVPDKMRVVIVTGKQANGTPTVLQAAVNNNKKTKYDVDLILSYVKNGDPNQNFLCIGGCISLQGTSSLAYPIKNYRIYFKNVAKEEGLFYLGCNELGIGGELQSKAKFSFRLASSNNYAAAPVNCFCTKADFAESSSSHNTGMARIVLETLTSIGELVPPLKYVNRELYKYDIRTTVDGEPCLFFYRGTIEETPQFLGKFNWNNDKSTEAVFGFLDIPGYHDLEWINEKFGGTNPTECWEFLNNDYPMGMFLDDDFDSKDSKGVPNWLKVFEARFPDDDNINAEYEAGTRKPKYLEALVKWVKSTDTTEVGLSETLKQERALKFKNELANYFDVKYLCDYYEFTDIFACVDQRVKNMMMAFWYSPEVDKMLAYMIFYDNDTILGVRNDGRLKYNWDVDLNTIDSELSTGENTVYAFAGHDSVLWKNLREQFPNELKEAYIRIRAKLTNDNIFNIFDKEQSEKFCERIYNLDAINKYIIPKTIGIEVNLDNVISTVKYSYLEAMQGSRSAHRHWFVTNRMGLFDAWASTGQYTLTDISFKGNSPAGASVRAIPSRDFYFEFKREGNTMVHDKVYADLEWSYTYDLPANIGTIFHLYGGLWMKLLDLSNWGGFTDLTLPILPVLKSLILGNSSKTYNITELVIGNKLPMLENLDMLNYINISALDLSGCTRIKSVNVSGCTSLSTISFAQGAPLSSLHLPENYKTLTLRSLSNITLDNIIFDNINSITGLWIENCANLDGFKLFKKLFALDNRAIKYVRLPNLVIKGDGNDLEEWYNANIGGIDAYGNLINNKCKIGGYYYLTSYIDNDRLAKYQERFDELNIQLPEYTMICIDESITDESFFASNSIGCITNLDNNTGNGTSSIYSPSGHISMILNQCHRYLGKLVSPGNTIKLEGNPNDPALYGRELNGRDNSGKLLVIQLADEDSRYFNTGYSSEATKVEANLDGLKGHGEVGVKFPAFWYKGVNLIIPLKPNIGKKYICFSSLIKKPSISSETKSISIDSLKTTNINEGYDEGVYKLNYKLNYTNEPNYVLDRILSDSKYDIYRINVEGFKKMRFPVSIGYTCSLFTDENGKIITDSEGSVNNIGEIYLGASKYTMPGMGVITTIPTEAKYFYLSLIKYRNINNNKLEVDAVDIVLHKGLSYSNGDDMNENNANEWIADMEPDWVYSDATFIHAVECADDGNLGLYTSFNGTQIAARGSSNKENDLPTIGEWFLYSMRNAAYNRGLQLIDYEGTKLLAILFMAKYGRRSSQHLLGSGSNNNNRRLGVTRLYGMKDTTVPKTAGGSQYVGAIIDMGNNTYMLVDSPSFLGIENIHGNVSEWCDRVYIVNEKASHLSKLRITMPDLSTRRIYGNAPSNNYPMSIINGKFCDTLSASSSVGSAITGYCDLQYINEYNIKNIWASAKGFRRSLSSNIAFESDGGIFCADNHNSVADALIYAGSRLLFRGNIIETSDIDLFNNTEEWRG